ncbi:hypothetical protein L460_04964 [Klebsiella pneumoniae BIDMC 24]|uniref:Lipoprotein n=2 Tax=Gammaproteobacteria TaxID=1236 RepID=A0A2K1Q532_9GAMM|nr:hypothetical protein [Klebsiella pneumoniae]ESL46573.1 hypothetical protein L460_04964 [Klebsiella pneumoniae BIDMC 24]PNS10149.1 hypothetical protein COO59_18980 [Mixta theicola]HBQ2314444.1 hypothetical protein [Klebsiella variicola]HDK6273475.1 hypothetical protein [Klebsiella quasipneumoniae]HDS9535925.1 hypothetical protein [Klebsiella pneumoniae subsp. pneumoniae]
MNRMITAGVICALLSGCAGSDFASINKNISDTAFSISKTLRGSDSDSMDSGNGMPVLTKASGSGGESASKQFSVPVDIDTAAARLKRHYGYVSADEIERIRSRDRNSRWSAAAIEDAHPVWESVPGSSYRMGSDVGDNDHMDIELEKNGSGTRVYVTYKSPVASHLTGSAFNNVVSQVRQVASGQAR